MTLRIAVSCPVPSWIPFIITHAPSISPEMQLMRLLKSKQPAYRPSCVRKKMCSRADNTPEAGVNSVHATRTARKKIAKIETQEQMKVGYTFKGYQIRKTG
jgi:hypothetical protein